MKKLELVNCPICNSNKIINLLELNCGNLDNSSLYQHVRINLCLVCGHIYNRLSSDEIDRLLKYYNEEYAPTNLGSTDRIGDRPGSNNRFTTNRYAQLYRLISSYINKDSRVLDIGCAMGGFLDYLHQRGLNNLYGIDIIQKYVNYAKERNDYNIKLGSAESIPFDDNSFDLLIIDQVMEHLVEPKKAFKEARRVLVDGGMCYIGLPDALRYDEYYFFDFYWFIMREHIQHFDIEHLNLLAEMEGFELLHFNKYEAPLINEKMLLPCLNAVFQLKSGTTKINISEKSFVVKEKIKQYISNDLEKLNKKREIIENLVATQKPLYIWGIGREFLYLYESTGLKNCNIIGLIDANPYKQENFSVNSRRIIDKSILKEAPSNSGLIISTIAHIEQIKNELSEMDYKGQVVEV